MLPRDGYLSPCPGEHESGYRPHGHQQGFTVSERDGRRGTAAGGARPRALNTGAGGSAEVYQISCASPGNCAAGANSMSCAPAGPCTAAGNYISRSGKSQGFIVSRTR
jgi:hypothetical protein